jgi:hypothetical protein
LPALETASLEKAQKIIDDILPKGVDRDKLFGRGRWRDLSAVRKQAVHRVWKEAKVGVTEIGRLFHRTPSAISQIIRAMETASGSRSF